MSGNDWDDDDDDFGDSNGIKQLRKQYKEMQAALTAEREKNAELAARVRSRELADVLSTKGVNPKAAKFFPRDTDPTPEAIEAWLKENEDILPFAKKSEEEAPPEKGNESQEQNDPQQQRPPLPDPNLADDWTRLAQVTGAGAITPDLQGVREKALRELAADQTLSPEEFAQRVDAVLKQQG
jgi:hypothetical protein